MKGIAVEFEILTKDFLNSHIEEFIRILNNNLEGEYWNEDHFLAELNKKWDYSFFARDEEGKIMGYVILSEKEASVHIHKFVVDAPFQSKGLGSRMMNHILEKATKPVTLKVSSENHRALQFYSMKGFVPVYRQGNQRTMMYKSEVI